MTKPAGKIVSLTELRFKPANSNDAARAVVAHHFAEVPACAFGKDDGISPYIGSETGIGVFPDAFDAGARHDADTPAIQSEAHEANGGPKRKLMRGGFALSVFLHAALAIAVGFATLAVPEEPEMEEGITSVTLVVEGDVEAHIAGAEENRQDDTRKPVEVAAQPIQKPATDIKPVEAVKPVQKVVPLPLSNLPRILTAEDSKTETEAVSPNETVEKTQEPVVEKPIEQKTPKKRPDEKPKPVEKKVEPVVEKPITRAIAEKPVEQKPVEKQAKEEPKPIEKKTEPKKEDEKRPELKKKTRPQEDRQQNHGNRGEQQNERHKGDVDAQDKGRASTSSKGASTNRETGNAARTNYKGLVNRKLSRAKGRIAAPAKGEVTVGFTILSDGSISGLSVTRSSGKAALDAIALKVVRNALPFPPIPAEAGKQSWKMTVPMTFKGG